MQEAIALARAGRAEGLRERGRRRAREHLHGAARARQGAAAGRAGDSRSPRRAAAPRLAAGRCASHGQLHLDRGELDDAEAASRRRASYLAEAGAAWALGRTLNFSAWAARHKGDLPKAERLYRESIRILAPLEDRGDALREPARPGRAPVRSRAASTRPSGSRSSRARDRRPARHHLALDDDACRSGSCARRRGATRRRSSCCARRTSRSRRASTGCTRWVPSRRWLSSCASAAARTRPRELDERSRGSLDDAATPPGSPDPTPGRATPRSPSPDARSGAALRPADPRAAFPRRRGGAWSRCGSRRRCRRSGCGRARPPPAPRRRPPARPANGSTSV